jgi:hypothetical protein
MPTDVLLPPVLTAGIVALVLLWPRFQGGPPSSRLFVEFVITIFAVYALLVGLIMALQRVQW